MNLWLTLRFYYCASNRPEPFVHLALQLVQVEKQTVLRSELRKQYLTSVTEVPHHSPPRVKSTDDWSCLRRSFEDASDEAPEAFLPSEPYSVPNHCRYYV